MYFITPYSTPSSPIVIAPTVPFEGEPGRELPCKQFPPIMVEFLHNVAQNLDEICAFYRLGIIRRLGRGIVAGRELLRRKAS